MLDWFISFCGVPSGRKMREAIVAKMDRLLNEDPNIKIEEEPLEPGSVSSEESEELNEREGKNRTK